MKRIQLITAVSVAAFLTAGAISANATLSLTVDDGGVGVPVVLLDGNGDGVIAFSGSIGIWSVVVNVGATKPNLGTATNPKMDMTFFATSTGAAGDTLTFTFAEDGLLGGGYGPLATSAGTVYMKVNSAAAGGKVDYSTSVNGFGTSAPTQGPGAFDNTTLGLATGLTAVSWPMSQTVKLTHGAGTYTTSGDAFLAVPEPTTVIAGALLLLPFGASTLRILRRNRTTV